MQTIPMHTSYTIYIHVEMNHIDKDPILYNNLQADNKKMNEYITPRIPTNLSKVGWWFRVRSKIYLHQATCKRLNTLRFHNDLILKYVPSLSRQIFPSGSGL